MPTPPSPAVLEAIARELETINRYPDLTAAPLREALAQRYGVGADQVCVGTGSSAILVAALSAVCQPGTQVVFPWRSFESYPIAVPSVGGDPVPVELLPDGTHDLDAMRAAITPDTVAVIVCSPNNPTGPALTYEEIAAFVADVPDDVMIIVDEAYIDFATKPGVRTAVPLIKDHPNVIVMRTFSKAHALAGVRVGYAIGEAEVIGAIQALLVPSASTPSRLRRPSPPSRTPRACRARSPSHRRTRARRPGAARPRLRHPRQPVELPT